MHFDREAFLKRFERPAQLGFLPHKYPNKPVKTSLILFYHYFTSELLIVIFKKSGNVTASPLDVLFISLTDTVHIISESILLQKQSKIEWKWGALRANNNNNNKIIKLLPFMRTMNGVKQLIFHLETHKCILSPIKIKNFL